LPVAHGLKIDGGTAREHLRALARAHLVEDGDGSSIEVNDTGKAQWRAIRSAVAGITEGLWGDLPEEDLATAARVLNLVLSRANALLDRP
jgi:hypothetical protein